MRVNSLSLVNSSNFSQKVSKKQKQSNYLKSSYMGDTVSFGNVIRPPEMSGLQKPINSLTEIVAKKINELKPTSIRLGFKDYELPVQNMEIAANIKESYNANSFKKLFRTADKNGVFDFNVDEKTGFVKTSNFVPKNYEEEKMAKLVWVTDTCRNISLLKKERPELCTKAVESLSRFYKHQQTEFDNVIANPELFKKNHGWDNGGVFHEFYPETNQPNHDFPRTRLESMGHYLQRSSELIMAGLEKGKNYGYKNAEEISDNTINAISSCVKYLKTIHYPSAHSCGAWEEKTFGSSLTSDTAIINEGMRRTLSIIFKKSENPEINKIQERLLHSKHGDVFKNKEELNNLLKDGENRIIKNHNCEAPGERGLDAALSFVTHYKNSKLTFSNNVIEDVKENVKLLKSLEGNESSHGLVGEYGVKRYLGDAYKNLDYDIPAKKGKLNENHEAEWFMSSDIAKGYGIQLKKLTDMIEKENRMPNKEEKELIDLLLKKETEYINRSFARTTGPNALKANGEPCPANKIPEAYQAITDKYNNVKYVPGTNTPLAWGQSSLVDASKVFFQNLKALEKFNPVKSISPLSKAA